VPPAPPPTPFATAPLAAAAPRALAAPKPGAAAPPVPRPKPPTGPRGNPAVCPGLENGACTLPCQRATCGALSEFFRITYNDSIPWNNVTGWELLGSVGCGRLVTPAAAARPAYCGWPGLFCCEPRHVELGQCAIVNAIANITMPVDQVNVSLSNPGFLDALEQLHSCGLVVLNLEANELTGRISPRFGALHNLRVLDIGARGRSGGQVAAGEAAAAAAAATP
jgi:hypothetical protein